MPHPRQSTRRRNLDTHVQGNRIVQLPHYLPSGEAHDRPRPNGADLLRAGYYRQPLRGGGGRRGVPRSPARLAGAGGHPGRLRQRDRQRRTRQPLHALRAHGHRRARPRDQADRRGRPHLVGRHDDRWRGLQGRPDGDPGGAGLDTGGRRRSHTHRGGVHAGGGDRAGGRHEPRLLGDPVEGGDSLRQRGPGEPDNLVEPHLRRIRRRHHGPRRPRGHRARAGRVGHPGGGRPESPGCPRGDSTRTRPSTSGPSRAATSGTRSPRTPRCGASSAARTWRPSTSCVSGSPRRSTR